VTVADTEPRWETQREELTDEQLEEILAEREEDRVDDMRWS
jgi:hypothetical protein